MSAARAPRRSARDASAAATGSAAASARAATGSGSAGSGSTGGAGRERAIEQLLDADPRGPYHRASRIMVSSVVVLWF